ncbi:hypothetical protein FQR65_LT00817 [Abscondita terminalis]|nr:hypothetical protein FQR65_LT00817 [Abscondita terminalis]
MQEVKIIVSVLCKHLNLLFQVNFKPEFFRLAKFNKNDDNVVCTFWVLLGRLLDIPQSENFVHQIKRHFLSVVKYKNAHFYALPEDMSSGSRELLLAVAYLLAQNYLNKNVMKIVSNSLFNSNIKFEDDNEINTPSKYTFDLDQIKTEDDVENALKWIDGQIAYNEREYQEYRDSFYKLWMKKNNFYVNTCYTVPYLSELEIIALCNEAEGKEFLERTEIVTKVVHNHRKWLHVQSEFWKWMNSVILEREKNLKGINMKDLNNYVLSL